jgi:hypothetical protein
MYGIIFEKGGRRGTRMLEIHKKIVLDEEHRPFAVQVPIAEFERLEEVIENYGLSKLMDEVKDEEKLSIEDAQTHYKSSKTKTDAIAILFLVGGCETLQHGVVLGI